MSERQLIKDAVKEAIEEKLGDFFVEREEHYQHHQFIKDLICYTEKIKGTACKTVTSILIAGVVSLLILGFVFWGKEHLK